MYARFLLKILWTAITLEIFVACGDTKEISVITGIVTIVTDAISLNMLGCNSDFFIYDPRPFCMRSKINIVGSARMGDIEFFFGIVRPKCPNSADTFSKCAMTHDPPPKN